MALRDFTFETRNVRFPSEAQARALELCGLPVQTYGEFVDPASLLEVAAKEVLRTEMGISGYVMRSQHIDLLRTPLLGKSIELTGSLALQPEGGGRGASISRIRLRTLDGRPLARIESCYERLNASRPTRRAERREGMQGQVMQGSTGNIREVRLLPENVAEYFRDSANPIHSSEQAARQFGLRAPVAGAGMTARFLTASLWGRTGPAAFRAALSYRRPVFWDDTCSVVSSSSRGAKEFTLQREGKVLVEIQISDVRPYRVRVRSTGEM